MKQSKQVVDARRDLIFNELIKHNEVSVIDLAEKLQVSEPTIRRDLLFFEHKSLVERYYGGARLLNYQSTANPKQNFKLTKNSLAKRAAEYIDNGDTVFINTSSTAILVLKYLENKDVTVITNNGNAMFMKYGKNVTVILSGGEVQPNKGSMSGDYALQTMSQIYASKTIIGCSSFSVDGGVTTSVHREVKLNQTMLNNCRGKRILLVDHTKLGHSANYSTGTIDDIDVLITDSYADSKFIDDLKAHSTMAIDLVKPMNDRSINKE